MCGGGAGVVMTDEEYGDAALGACRRRQEQREEEKESHRRRTRINISGPKRFAPAFAGETSTRFAHVLFSICILPDIQSYFVLIYK